MLKTCSLLLTLFVSRFTFAASVETTEVKTPRGASVKVAINVPDGPASGKRPAVLIAPGSGYHMELPIIKELAEKLAATGIIAFRFDWNYYSTDPQRGQSSAGLAKELEDMQSVISFVKAEARVDPAQIILAGKSMGSVVAFNAFIRDRSAKAAVLLTPLCSATTDESGNPIASPRPVGLQNYPTLIDLTKPVVVALGNADAACTLPNLFDWLKASKGNVATVVVGGDHGLNIVSSNVEDPRNAANISASVQIVSHWIKLITEK
jgi:predicted alpha/beta-hydrolase family hydrolase